MHQCLLSKFHHRRVLPGWKQVAPVVRAPPAGRCTSPSAGVGLSSHDEHFAGVCLDFFLLPRYSQCSAWLYYDVHYCSSVRGCMHFLYE